MASERLRRAGSVVGSDRDRPPGAASALPHPRFPGHRSRSRAESRAPSPPRTSPPPPGARAATKTPAAVRSSRTAVADCGGDESSRSGDPARAGASPPPSGLRRRSEAVTGSAPRRRASGPAPPPAAPPAPAATGPAEPALGLGAGGDWVIGAGGRSLTTDRRDRLSRPGSAPPAPDPNPSPTGYTLPLQRVAAATPPAQRRNLLPTGSVAEEGSMPTGYRRRTAIASRGERFERGMAIAFRVLEPGRRRRLREPGSRRRITPDSRPGGAPGSRRPAAPGRSPRRRRNHLRASGSNGHRNRPRILEPRRRRRLGARDRAGESPRLRPRRCARIAPILPFPGGFRRHPPVYE